MPKKMMRKLFLSDEILYSVEKPERYVGGEYNSVNKDFDSVPVHVCFCFPDLYEIGMANLGMQIIYEQFNRRPDSLCDRVYSPWFDLDKILWEQKIPLFSVESQRPVRDFDFLLITLQYEMCYTNVLRILELSQIPLFSADRKEDDPIVIGGGSSSYNPEPMADFFDVFYIGESETQYDLMVTTYRKCKEKGLSRSEILEALSEIPGLYVPSLYEVTYNEDGTIKERIKLSWKAPEKIERQVANLKDPLIPYPKKPIVPYLRSMMDRATLEVMRGCVRGCRFCQAGMIYRPKRERPLSYLSETAIEMLRNSGFDEINLSSLSTSDFSSLKELLDVLLPYCEAHHVNIGIPSLRIDSFSLECMSKIQDIKKTSLTFAPEAGTERLRRVINKGLTEETILTGAEEAFKGGWNKVKLYFMLGLPQETEEDVQGIADLSDTIAALYYKTVPKENRQGRVNVTISTSYFIPKPFTPFQWAPMALPETFLNRAYLLKDTIKSKLNQKSLSYHYHDEAQSVLEGLFARGDRKVGKMILKAYQKGCIFDAWSEYISFDKWEEARKETGISYDFYLYREREKDEKLPWDFIDAGINKEFLWNEWEKAKSATETLNCSESCASCGAMKYEGGICHERAN